MTKLKDYIQLHLNILLFSLTSVFSKLASVYYNKEGLNSPFLYLFLFLMIANCGIYAIAWQQVIKKFSLSTAYANKSVYLLWSQVWAVIIFHENLSIQNILIISLQSHLYGGNMTKLKDYIQLHLNILLFSLTSVFSKLASVYYNKEGLNSPFLYLFLFLMIANCGIYAIAWQQVIKKFSLSTAYANKSVYLLWSQVWAVIIFHENLSIQNIIGIMVVLVGVWMVQRYE